MTPSLTEKPQRHSPGAGGDSETLLAMYMALELPEHRDRAPHEWPPLLILDPAERQDGVHNSPEVTTQLSLLCSMVLPLDSLVTEALSGPRGTKSTQSQALDTGGVSLQCPHEQTFWGHHEHGWGLPWACPSV